MLIEEQINWDDGITTDTMQEAANKGGGMIVLGFFDQPSKDDDGELVRCEGWFFCSIQEFGNILAVFDSQKDEGLSIQLDTTHKMLFNGWALTGLNAETVLQSSGGKKYLTH